MSVGPRSSEPHRHTRQGGTLLIVGHASVNLTEGVGGPQDASVLYPPGDVAADLKGAGVEGLVIDRAANVRRRVQFPDGDRDAIDCLVRAHRTTEETP